MTFEESQFWEGFVVLCSIAAMVAPLFRGSPRTPRSASGSEGIE